MINSIQPISAQFHTRRHVSVSLMPCLGAVCVLTVAAWLTGVPAAYGQCPSSFAAAVNYPTDNNPYSVAIGDLNGDGRPDLAVANENIASTVSVLLGNGNGTFAAAVNYGAGTDPAFVAIGDLNGDGRPDLAVANYNSNNVSVLLNNGNGTFAAAANFGAGSHPRSVDIGDLNGDGKPDLAVANWNSANVSVLLGNGNGTFQAAANFGAGTNPVSVAIGDLNGDGKPDLVVANNGSGNVSVLLGYGNGTFAAAVNYPAGANPFSVAIRNFNGDGKPDLAVANYAVAGTVSVLLGNGNGTFAAGVPYAAGTNPISVAIGDFNGDGWPDLAVANYAAAGTVSVLLGNGNGTFQAAANFAAGTNPISVAIGDFNSDGRPDLVVANANSNNVSVLLSNNLSIRITQQPASQSVCIGEAANFSVLANVINSPSYQWRRGTTNLVNGGNISGATTTTLSINPVGSGDMATDYNCLVSNACPSSLASANAALSTITTITSQPQSLTMNTGAAAVFTVQATGGGAPSYQWRKGGNAVADGGSLSGATTATLTINPAQASAAGDYDVVVSSDACGPFTSHAATLSVTPSASGCGACGAGTLTMLPLVLAAIPVLRRRARHSGSGADRLEDRVSRKRAVEHRAFVDCRA